MCVCVVCFYNNYPQQTPLLHFLCLHLLCSKLKCRLLQAGTYRKLSASLHFKILAFKIVVISLIEVKQRALLCCQLYFFSYAAIRLKLTGSALAVFHHSWPQLHYTVVCLPNFVELKIVLLDSHPMSLTTLAMNLPLPSRDHEQWHLTLGFSSMQIFS